MKNFAKITLASLVLAVSSNLMADDDIEITASNNLVTQFQTGYNNDQDLKLGVVEDMYGNGDITITANQNVLVQSQDGNSNYQTMSIATVACKSC